MGFGLRVHDTFKKGAFMKTKQSIFCVFFAVIVALALTATTLFGATGCQQPTDDPKPIYPPIIPTPITKTHTITFKDGDLKFIVEYKALPTEAAPGYLAYLQTRLGVVVNSDNEFNVEATDYLMSKGNNFTIKVEYTGNSYEGLIWYTATKSFKVHNNWISTASSGDLSASIIRDAFNSVVIAAVRSNARETVRLAKAPADAKAVADAVIAQIPQNQTAINQKILLDRAMQNG